MSLLRLGADCEGLVLVAESDLILTSATTAPTVFRCFWLHRFSGGFGARTLGFTCTLGVAVTLMSRYRYWSAYQSCSRQGAASARPGRLRWASRTPQL